MRVGVGGTHITRYLLENVPEVLLLFTFRVSVARPWLWKHKGKLVHRGRGDGQTREESSSRAAGARVPTIAQGGGRSWVQGKCSSFLSNLVGWSENHLGTSSPSLHASPAQTPQTGDTLAMQTCRQPRGLFPHLHQLEPSPLL